MIWRKRPLHSQTEQGTKRNATEISASQAGHAQVLELRLLLVAQDRLIASQEQIQETKSVTRGTKERMLQQDLVAPESGPHRCREIN